MTLTAALQQLESLGHEKVRAINTRAGAGPNQFGVKRGDIRKIADRIKTDHALALALWRTGNSDAQFLAILVLDPDALSARDLERMVREITFVQVADWFHSYVGSKHPDREALRRKWMTARHPMLARAGWHLTADRVSERPADLDLPALLTRIEAEMPAAAPAVQWTMNTTLARIGIHFPAHRRRAIAIGEQLGIYRDHPTPKGCTSPFAPLWIAAMVKRKG